MFRILLTHSSFVVVTVRGGLTLIALLRLTYFLRIGCPEVLVWSNLIVTEHVPLSHSAVIDPISTLSVCKVFGVQNDEG